MTYTPNDLDRMRRNLGITDEEILSNIGLEDLGGSLEISLYKARYGGKWRFEGGIRSLQILKCKTIDELFEKCMNTWGPHARYTNTLLTSADNAQSCDLLNIKDYTTFIVKLKNMRSEWGKKS
jgi:hypothetical protein